MARVRAWMIFLTVLIVAIFVIPPALAGSGSITIGLPEHIVQSGEDVIMQLYKLGVPNGDSWTIDNQYSDEIKASIIQIEADLRIGEDKSVVVEPAIEAIRLTIEEKKIPSIQSVRMQNGAVSFTGLDDGIYYAVMTTGPSEFIIQSPIIPIPYRYLGAVLREVAARPKVSEVVPPEEEFTTRSVRKVWEDANDLDQLRPANLVVRLLADGAQTQYSVTLNARNGWQATLGRLPLLNAAGAEIVYTWREDNVEGYTLVNTNVQGTMTTLTNRHEQERISRRVQKVWDDADDSDQLRPESLQVELLADGTNTGRVVTLNSENNWSDVIEDLPELNAEGETITYSWREPEIQGYEQMDPVVTGDLITLTNRHAPDFIALSVVKIWNDDADDPNVPDDQKVSRRPEKVTMELRANGRAIREVDLTKANNWQATIEHLPTRTASGAAVEYTWHEKQVLMYVLEKVETQGNVTTFTNALWSRPVPPPIDGVTPKTPGRPIDNIYIDDYETPLGIGRIINHVGDCYE